MQLTRTQLVLLEHLVAVAVRQKQEARITKKRFKGGWTYVLPTREVPLATLRRLIVLGFVTSCCEVHAGTDLVRVTRSGVEHLESIVGEVILA